MAVDYFAAVTRCVSAFFCQMAPIKRYLPVVSCSTVMVALNNANLSELSRSPRRKTKFIVSTRISRFSPIFRPATKMCLFRKILQPEGDVFGARHCLKLVD